MPFEGGRNGRITMQVSEYEQVSRVTIVPFGDPCYRVIHNVNKDALCCMRLASHKLFSQTHRAR